MMGQSNDQHLEDLQRLQRLRPMDDDFMRCLFKNNVPLVELVLRIITDKPDLVITHCETQKDMKRLAGARSLCLDAYGTDAYGTDTSGKKYDLEIQRQEKGADPHRARYHSSVLDIENLHPREDFNELPDTYTIFITEKDVYGKSEPLYPIERINLITGHPFKDGEHILYVNGTYRADSDIGRSMHDLNCTRASDMNFKLMADRTRYLKEDPKGVSEMCQIMEDMRQDARTKSLKEVALRMLTAKKYKLEEIAVISGLSLEKVKELKADNTL